MTDSQKLTEVAKLIKKRFSTADINDVLALAEEILKKIGDMK